MKRAVIAAFCLFSFFDGFAKYPVISRTTQGGLFGLYWSTNREIQKFQNDQGNWVNGVVISCKNPGMSTCPNSIPRNNPPEAGDPDDIDATYANDLVEYADLKMEAGIMQGSRSITVSVQGESFYRKYELTWTTSADGETVTKVERSDINKN